MIKIERDVIYQNYILTVPKIPAILRPVNLILADSILLYSLCCLVVFKSRANFNLY